LIFDLDPLLKKMVPRAWTFKLFKESGYKRSKQRATSESPIPKFNNFKAQHLNRAKI